MRWTKKMRTISLLLSVLLSAVLAASIYMVWQEMNTRQKEKEDFMQLAEMVEQTEESEMENSEIESEETEQAESMEEVIAGRNLAPLFEKNPDCIGWLYIEGTSVNYPLMHTPDEPQKYLRLNFDKEYSSAGVPFLDGRCSLNEGNLIIYGHNRKDGTMFADLKKYLDPEFLDSHRTIELETAGGVFIYSILEIRITDTSDEWYNAIKSESPENPRYLTLSTCYAASSNKRILVIAVEKNCVYKSMDNL